MVQSLTIDILAVVNVGAWWVLWTSHLGQPFLPSSLPFQLGGVQAHTYAVWGPLGLAWCVYGSAGEGKYLCQRIEEPTWECRAAVWGSCRVGDTNHAGRESTNLSLQDNDGWYQGMRHGAVVPLPATSSCSSTCSRPYLDQTGWRRRAWGAWR